MTKKINLPISPMKLEVDTTKTIPISKLKSGIRKIAEIDNAIVAFIDILGFSNKTEDKDIENTLLDFSGSLTLTARRYPNLRFNVFSDNAFIATSQTNANELIAALRFAFGRWCSNGILVRGGIAIGTYKEFSSAAIKSTFFNFTGNLFSGTAVTKAVKLENAGPGGLLFTDDECGAFLSKTYAEPIFSLLDRNAVAWSDDKYVLFQFIAISMFRLLRLVQLNGKEFGTIKEKLRYNIIFSLQIETSGYTYVSFLSILKMKSVNSQASQKVGKLFGVKTSDFKKWMRLIKIFLKTNDLELKILKGISDDDSSIP
jgi:hypothetical protein